MSETLRITLLAASAVLLAAMPGSAQPAPESAPPAAQARRARPAWRMTERLNLTEAQRQELRKLREENRAAAREDAGKLRTLRRQLHDALFADNPDEGRIAALKADVAQLTGQLEARRFDHQERMARILTAEQRTLLREQRTMRRERRLQRGQRMWRQFRARELRDRGVLRRPFRNWM